MKPSGQDAAAPHVAVGRNLNLRCGEAVGGGHEAREETLLERCHDAACRGCEIVARVVAQAQAQSEAHGF